MKKIIVLSALALACSGLAFSDPMPAACVTGGLGSYVNLGSTGCTVGNLLFYNFFVNSSPTSIGTNVLSSGVAPVPTTNNPGLAFNVGLPMTPPGGTQDVEIDYIVKVEAGAPITDSSFSVVASGGSAATEGECLGGLFSTGCSGGTQMSLTTNSTTLAASNTFTGTWTIDVKTDINSDGGIISGEAEHFSETSSTVPEPASLTLFGSGLLGLAFLLRRKVFTS
ncbi:MAG: PEP-CTERM sorting domain-containing protein [Terriglobia bacterium]